MTIAQKTSIWFIQALRVIKTQLLVGQIGGLSRCRYDESCGNYMGRQIKENGVSLGFLLGIKRIASCQGLL